MSNEHVWLIVLLERTKLYVSDTEKHIYSLMGVSWELHICPPFTPQFNPVMDQIYPHFTLLLLISLNY